jgi:hypothetical protein
MSKCHMMSQCVTSILFLSYVTVVTFVSNIIVIGHLMCHRRLPTTDFQSCWEGGEGWREGGVKKCFLGLRQTALLSAEGKNKRKRFRDRRATFTTVYIVGW